MADYGTLGNAEEIQGACGSAKFLLTNVRQTAANIRESLRNHEEVLSAMSISSPDHVIMIEMAEEALRLIKQTEDKFSDIQNTSNKGGRGPLLGDGRDLQ